LVIALDAAGNAARLFLVAIEFSLVGEIRPDGSKVIVCLPVNNVQLLALFFPLFAS
jgi:hypothetical protein